MKKLLLRSTLILINVSFFLSGAFAQFVSAERAKNIVVSLFNERKPSHAKMLTINEIEIESLKYHNGIPVYYIFNLSGNAFIIIAADERIYPVLGYSFQSSFDEQNVPDCMDWLLGEYQEQIYDVVAHNLNYKDQEIHQAWEKYEVNGSMQKSNPAPLPAPMSVSPLTTTTWSQGCYYNENCPADNSLGTTRCGRVPTGCVATAFGQVMKYHNYPAQGTGSNSYSSNYGTMSANFGATTYNWANMPNKLLTNNLDVAQLLFHAGVSIDMDYGPNGSSAYATDVRTALVNKFKYASTAQNVSKSSYSNTQWENLIRTELDAQRVVLINGHDPAANAGHAFIADGYQGTNSFHINWGWNGSSDGYFLLTALSPSSYSFNTSVGAIIGIKPLSTTTTCSMVTGLSASNITSNSATLNWASTGTANSYNIKYKETTSSTWTTVSSTTTSKTISGLSPATSYHFQAQRVCSGTSSSNYSASTTFTTSSSSSSNTTVTVGSGTGTTGAAPYGTGNMDERAQFIVTKNQLVAAGYASSANFIKSLAFNVASANAKTMTGFTIKVGHTTASDFSSTSFLNTTMTTVYSGNVTVTNGWNTHTFTTAFPYNGSSNLLIEICWDNSSSASNSTVKYTSTSSSYQTLYKKANVTSGGICSSTSGGSRSYSRPNMKFVFSSSALKMLEVPAEETSETIDNKTATLQVFPNPAQNTATVQFDGTFEQAHIAVFDITGKQILSDNMTNSTYLLQVEPYTPGIYLVVIQSGNNYFTKKLMVKREL